MRDPKRIDKILKEISDIWHKNPDLRLGQLICNVVRDPALYYVEDEMLVEAIKRFYSEE